MTAKFTKESKFKSSGRLLATILALICCQRSLGAAKVVQSLRGVDVYESTDFNGFYDASFAGGSDITIAGYGFNSNPAFNQVYLTTSELSSASITLACPPLSENDEFRSMAADGKLVYTLPKFSNLFNGLTLEDFKSFGSIQGHLTVVNTETGNTLECSNKSRCRVKYQWGRTAQVVTIMPPVVYKGMTMAIRMFTENADGFYKGEGEHIEFKIDGTRLDYGDYTKGATSVANRADETYRATVMSETKNMTASLTAKFRGTGYAYNRTDLAVYSLDGASNYTMKLLPSIESVSHSTGYATGGQLLTITGYGLDGEDVSVLVDDVPCTVKSVSTEQITCVTGARGTLPDPAPAHYIGQQGLRHYFFYDSNAVSDGNWRNYIGSDQEYERGLWTAPEISGIEYFTYSVVAFTGYFRAPADGEYRFWMACDDYCRLWMTTEGENTLDPTAAEKLLERDRYTSFRNFDNTLKPVDGPNQGKIYTRWIRLSEGEHYFFETSFQNEGGPGHLSIPMEVKLDTPPADHPQSVTAIQRIRFFQSDIQYDTMEIRVADPDQGTFILQYLNQANSNFVQSGEITAGTDAASFQNAIKGYYKNKFGVEPLVELTYETSEGVVTTEGAPDATVYLYTIEVPTSIAVPSVETILLVPLTTTSTVTFVYSTDVQLSSPPISGSFWIKCYDTDGSWYATQDMDATSTGAKAIKSRLDTDCPFLKGKISVTRLENPIKFREMGLEFQIDFKGVNGPLELYEIIPSYNDTIVGVNVAYENEEIRAYGESIYFPVVPPEYLFTDEVEPQVIVQVDEFPVLCAKLNCDFTYAEQTSEITAFTVSGTDVTITGTSLPTDILEVSIGRVPCSIDSNSETEIVCTLEFQVPAGEWLPIIKDEFGLIKIADTVTVLTVDIIITDISPKTGLNPAGGTTLTITGQNFPESLENGFDLTLSVGGALCVPQTITPTQIICVTQAFPVERRRRLQDAPATIDLTITIVTDADDVTYTEQGFELLADPLTTVSVTPSRISPIAFTTIVIELAATYPTAGMTKEDFSVTLVPITLELTYLTINNGGVRPLNVIAVDTDAKTITVKYGGAYSGTYDLQIDSVINGRIDALSTPLLVVFEINSIEPSTGSIFGGSVLTIGGGPFTLDLKETIVRVGTNWWEGIDDYCYVFEVAESEVKCRLPLDLNRQAKEYEVVVFSATFEEANCNLESNCLFTFIAAADLPEVTSYDSAFNTASGKYEITITGVGFPTDSAELWLNEVSQTVTDLTTTSVVVEVSDIASGLTTNKIDLFFPIGIPNGYTELLSGVTFTPKLVSLSTNQVSVSGSTIQARVEGMGLDDELTLIDATTQTDLCLASKMISYGTLECELEPSFDYSSTITLQVKEKISGLTHECASTQPTDCQLSLLSSQPKVITVEKTSSMQIRFTGGLFQTSGFTCTVKFANAMADTCVINSMTEVVADYTKGIGIQETEVAPILSFVADDTTYAHKAEFDPLAVLQNPLSVSSITADLSSSFAGGPALTIVAQGLTQSVISGDKEVLVSSKTCSVDLDASDPDQLVCKVPSITTTKSNELFQITEEGNMYGAETIQAGMTRQDSLTVYDGASLPAIQNTASGCFIGIKFSPGYVGVLNEVSIFLDYFDTENIVDKLHVQASSDNFVADVVELALVGEEAHEGWNYYAMDESDYFEDNGALPAFSSYRLFSEATSNGCDDIGEIRWIGQEVIDDIADTYDCSVEMVTHVTDPTTGELSKDVADQGATVTYDVNLTPKLTDISPMYGGVEGNDEVTFTGTFQASITTADISIRIDDRDCAVQSVSTTEIVCVTAPRIGAWEADPKLDFSIEGYGNVATQGLVYRYCSAWSQDSTWGFLFAPVDGESVAVPKGLCLLVDIDTSPKLKLVQVDGGSLIFPSHEDPNHHRTFDAGYIMINNGTMIVGTEEHPYTSKLTITMYGSKYDPAVPIYGKKSIGVRFSTLDMHGVHKKSWTDLESTISPGDSTFQLVEVVDWEIGDEILVTSTNYNQWEAEIKRIVAIDNSSGTNSEITVESAFKNTHVAGVEMLDGPAGDTLTVRAEVTLMTRNIVYRGDPETSQANKFGAHIMMASPGDESSIGRIENVQLTDVGQAFLLGKYPIHFHMIGRVTKSYVRNNAIYRSYNRGTTIHGVQYLRVSRNTYFDVMGHTIFVEDAAETKNLIEYNVIAGTKPSFSLLGTDQTPGCFWITHPDNIFVGNRAAGSTNYGFWMDYQDTAIGPSFNPNIKPLRAKLGEFRNNVAHSVGNYGLRIFHGHTPVQTALYQDHLSYKCGKNGIMSGEMGRITFKNITVASNRQHGFEMERIVAGGKDETNIIGAVVVGSSPMLGGSTSVGIVGPQSDKWYVTDARFYHFTDGAGALGDCSNCESPKGDSGVRTYRSEQLYFDDATVTKRIKWLVPFKGIMHDLDGTLTKLGPDSYATAYWKHNEWPECTVDMDLFTGIICPHPWSVRRIVFNGASGNIFRKDLFLWQYDTSITNGMTDEDKDAYLVPANASEVAFKEKENPMFHWAIPFVTGHRYFARWAAGLDFESVKVDIVPWLWDNEDDQSVVLALNHYEIREAVVFETNTGIKANNTMLDVDFTDYVFGHNVVFNQTEQREIYFIVNGVDGSSQMKMTGLRCVSNCEDQNDPVGPDDEEEIPDGVNYWSNSASWPDGRVPVAGDEVVINANMNITYDLGESPLFQSIEVNGNLTFKYGEPALVHAYAIWVRAGTLNVGSEDVPFDSTVEFRLHGNITSPSEFVFSQQVPVSNKNFIITGTVKMYGKKRSGSARLLESAFPAQDQLILPKNLDWKEGDYLGLAASNIDPLNSETVVLKTYDPSSGVATVESALTGYHFGAAKSTGDKYSGVDMRAEVMLLSRDVNITASTDALSKTTAHPTPWGCRVLVSDFFEPRDLVYRKGTIFMDNVSIYNCSQTDTKYAALTFNNALQGQKVFTNGAISSGAGEGIHVIKSRLVTVRDSVIHDFVLFGHQSEGSYDITFENNIMNGIRPDSTDWSEQQNLVWPYPTGGWDMVGTDNLVFKNNTAASMWHSGFRLPSKQCGESSSIKGNIAHSISGMGVIVYSSTGSCSEFSSFRGYKNQLATVIMGVGGENKATDIISIDSFIGLAIQGSSGNRVEVRGNTLYGSKDMENSDCPLSSTGKCKCRDRTGVINPTFSTTPIEIKNNLKIKKMFAGGGGWGGESLFIDNTFIGFDSRENICGGKQAAIGTNGYHPDYHPMAHFRRNKFIDTDITGMFGFKSPPKGWANFADCGAFTCTGLYNNVFKVSESSYSGIPLVSGMPSSYQVTSNNKESVSSQVVPTCEKMTAWNAYLCTEENIAVLLFESQDADRMDRFAQPIYIMDEDRGFNNRLNAYMDTGWDGAYTSQKREQRFPTMIDTSRNYTIEYTGTPPQKQRFTLYNDAQTSGTLITIRYPDNGAFKIYKEDQTLAIPTEWDYNIEQYAVPTGRYCGENRYLGVFNVLQFWIEPGCTLLVRPRDAVMLAIRLEWTVKQFFEEKAIAKFTDRMAAVLGVARADLKIVQVYEGSVIINFQVIAEVEEDEEAEDPIQETVKANKAAEKKLKQIAKKYEEAVPKLAEAELGAPVISIQTAEGSVVPLPGWEDYVSDNKGFNDLIDKFIDSKETTTNPGDGVILIPQDKPEEQVPEEPEEVTPEEPEVPPEEETSPPPEEEETKPEVTVVKKVVTVYETVTNENDEKIAKNVFVLTLMIVMLGFGVLIVYLCVRLCRNRGHNRRIVVLKTEDIQNNGKVIDGEHTIGIVDTEQSQYRARPDTETVFRPPRKSQRQAMVGRPDTAKHNYEGDVESNLFGDVPNLLTENSRRNEFNTSQNFFVDEIAAAAVNEDAGRPSDLQLIASDAAILTNRDKQSSKKDSKKDKDLVIFSGDVESNRDDIKSRRSNKRNQEVLTETEISPLKAEILQEGELLPAIKTNRLQQPMAFNLDDADQYSDRVVGDGGEVTTERGLKSDRRRRNRPETATAKTFQKKHTELMNQPIDLFDTNEVKSSHRSKGKRHKSKTSTRIRSAHIGSSSNAQPSSRLENKRYDE